MYQQRNKIISLPGHFWKFLRTDVVRCDREGSGICSAVSCALSVFVGYAQREGFDAYHQYPLSLAVTEAEGDAGAVRAEIQKNLERFAEVPEEDVKKAGQTAWKIWICWRDELWSRSLILDAFELLRKSRGCRALCRSVSVIFFWRGMRTRYKLHYEGCSRAVFRPVQYIPPP